MTAPGTSVPASVPGSDDAAPAGPPPRYWALGSTVTAEAGRRVRRAGLIAAGGGLLSAFALGASVLPMSVTSDLLVAYLVFLAVYGAILALALLRELGGPYGAAMTVGEFARSGTLAEWRATTGDPDPPRSPADAAAWLQRHPDDGSLPGQRLSALLLTGDLAAARQALAQYPRSTPFERYDHAADAWFLDFLEGATPPPAEVEAAVREVSDAGPRARADAGLAVLRAHLAEASGADWIAPLATARPLIPADANTGWRGSMIVRVWTLYMAAGALLIGVALLIARLTGVWGTDLR